MLDEDEESMPPLSKAIFEGNPATVGSLLSTGADVNVPDADGCTPLHYAVFYGRRDSLKLLLSQPAVNVDYKNNHGETPLLMAIKCRRDIYFVTPLLEAGADVNTQTDTQEIALHLAIAFLNNCVAHELIKQGANVDILDECNQTALHSAVEKRNMEGCCMLLYYDADVTYSDHNDMTPLMYAISDGCDEIAKVLIDYYVIFSNVSILNESALEMAIKFHKDYAVDMIRACEDTDSFPSLLEIALVQGNLRAFEEILQRMNNTILLLELSRPIIYTFITNRSLSNICFLKYLFIMLESSAVDGLIDHCAVFKPKLNLWGQLLNVFLARNINVEDRIKIMYTLLSLGFPVHFDDVVIAYFLCGPGEEAKTLAMCTKFPQSLLV